MAKKFLLPTESLVTMTNFPLLGTSDCFEPNVRATPTTGASQSLFISDEAITKHVRFPYLLLTRTLTANIRKRRGEKVAINLPLFFDTKTPKPFKEELPNAVLPLLNGYTGKLTVPDFEPQALVDHVYLDCMCFGMGCSCLQVTIQACTVEAGRRLYDHLTVMTPIMLALSACAPIFRGYLVDVDCRWEVIAGSVDDRTRQERSLEPLTTDRFVIPKSRYDSVTRYLSPGPNVSGTCAHEPDFNRETEGSRYYKPEYNDLPEVYDKEIYTQLIEGGVDDLLAKHYAHLFIRDPLVVFSEMLNIDDENNGDHFEVLMFKNRIYSQPIGKLCGSSHHRLVLILDGELSSDQWTYSLQTTKMQRSLFLLSC